MEKPENANLHSLNSSYLPSCSISLFAVHLFGTHADYFRVGVAVPAAFSFLFVMTTLTIFATDALWAVVLGPVILALGYGFFSKRKLLYSDLLNLPLKPQWSKTRSLAMLVFGVRTVLCLAIPLLFSFNVWLLLPFMLL